MWCSLEGHASDSLGGGIGPGSLHGGAKSGLENGVAVGSPRERQVTRFLAGGAVVKLVVGSSQRGLRNLLRRTQLKNEPRAPEQVTWRIKSSPPFGEFCICKGQLGCVLEEASWLCDVAYLQVLRLGQQAPPAVLLTTPLVLLLHNINMASERLVGTH